MSFIPRFLQQSRMTLSHVYPYIITSILNLSLLTQPSAAPSVYVLIWSEFPVVINPYTVQLIGCTRSSLLTFFICTGTLITSKRLFSLRQHSRSKWTILQLHQSHLSTFHSQFYHSTTTNCHPYKI